MDKENLYEAMGNIDEKRIHAAHAPAAKKKPVWVKWGAMAACLCLIVGGVFMFRENSPAPNPGPAGGPSAPGGNFPEGVDPIIASVAVYPETADITEVEDATTTSWNEAEAYSMEQLGGYLPTALPDGYHFSRASLYETTMKDGTKYYMLRVTYGNGTPRESQNIRVESDEPAPDPAELGDEFVVFVMNFKPKTERQIYSPAEITEDRLEEIGGLTFHLVYDEVYVGLSPNGLSPQDVLAVIASID